MGRLISGLDILFVFFMPLLLLTILFAPFVGPWAPLVAVAVMLAVPLGLDLFARWLCRRRGGEWGRAGTPAIDMGPACIIEEKEGESRADREVR